MAHYHLFTLALGKEYVERVYVPLDMEQPTAREDAEKRLTRRQRKRVLQYRVCHPTSWWRAQPAQPLQKRRRRT